MPSGNLSQFPITVSPSGVRDLPTFEVRDFDYFEHPQGKWLIVGEVLESKSLPVDFYLDEMLKYNLEHLSTEEVIKFAREWGVCVDPLYRDIPEAEEDVMYLAANYGELAYSEQSHGSNGFTTARINAAELAGEISPMDRSNFGWDYEARKLPEYEVARNFINVGEIRARLENIQYLVEVHKHWRDHYDSDITDSLTAMNCLLSPFSVRVSVPGFEQLDQQPHVLNIAALQLANDISLDISEFECQNESCYRPDKRFTRQRGGATQGQYRTAGVLYCSTECRDMQNQRNYRRRKASEKQGGNK